MEIKTKYNLGDTRWVMYNNKPTKICIDRIDVTVAITEGGCQENVVNCGWYRPNERFRMSDGELDKKTFATLDNLLNSFRQ